MKSSGLSPQARLLRRMVLGRLARNITICLGVFVLIFILLATFVADPVATFLADTADSETFVVPSSGTEQLIKGEAVEYMASRPDAIWDIQTNPVDGTITVRDLTFYYFVDNLWFPMLVALCLLSILLLVLAAFRRMYSLVDDLTAAVSGIIDGQDEPVSLPPELAVAQGELEDLRRESIEREAAAERDRRRTHELMAYLTHDVRTPLTAVLGNLELLSERRDLDDVASTEVATALRRSVEMESLTGDLFDMTRLALDPSSIARQPVDLGLITLQVMEELGGAPKKRSNGDPEAHRAYEAIGKPVTVLADPDLLAKAVEHLLRSARALDNRHSDIDLIGGAKEGTAFLTAHVPMANQDANELQTVVAHAFEPYYRKGSSNGVSLAFAREIARAHGGDVAALAREDAIELTLTLPVAAPSSVS